MRKMVIYIFSFVFFSLQLLPITSLANQNNVSANQNTEQKSEDDNVNLLNFAADAAVTMYSYNFAIYQKQFHKMSKYFTQEGWKKYKKALNQSGNLDTVINKKLVVSAVPTGAPVILNQKAKDRTTWTIQIPLLVTYESVRSSQEQHLLLTMEIVPAPEGKGVRNLLVDTVVARPMTASNNHS